MKKIILFFCTIFCTIGTTYAQWTNATNGADMYNINTGNVGVGTTTPASLFSVGSLSQFQVNSSGLTSLNNTTPEFRFINSADGSFARFLRGTSSSNNFFAGKNKVAQSGGTSKALNFTATPGNQYLSMPDNGLSTSSGFIVSFWINSTL